MLFSEFSVSLLVSDHSCIITVFINFMCWLFLLVNDFAFEFNSLLQYYSLSILPFQHTVLFIILVLFNIVYHLPLVDTGVLLISTLFPAMNDGSVVQVALNKEIQCQVS